MHTHTSLEITRTYAALTTAKDSHSLSNTLTDIFFSSSPASCETASRHLIHTTTSKTAASHAHILRSLPTAVPPRNARALASVAAFLAVRHAVAEDDQICAAPLMAFCYADAPVRRRAIRAMHVALRDVVRARDAGLKEALERVRRFVAEVLREADLADCLLVTRGLIRLGALHDCLRECVLSFVLDVCCVELSGDSVLGNGEIGGVGGDDGDGGRADRVEFLSFLFEELCRLAEGSEALALLLERSLVMSFEVCDIGPFVAVWTACKRGVSAAIDTVGLDVMLYLLLSNAASAMLRGELTQCHTTLQITNSVLQEGSSQIGGMHSLVTALSDSTCVSIASVCTAGGALDIARSAASLRQQLVHSARRHTNATGNCSTTATDGTHRLYDHAGTWGCPQAAMALGLLRKTLSLWQEPTALAGWLEAHVSAFLRGEAHKSPELSATSFAASGLGAVGNPYGGGYEGADDVNPSLNATPVSILCTASIAMASLGHMHPRVRFCAVRALEAQTNSAVVLFFLPATVTRLGEERNGAVAAQLLRGLLISPALLSEKETCKIALNAILRLMRYSDGEKASATKETALMALAEAACVSPGAALPLLLAEVEKLRGAFEDVQPSLKAAAAAAIARLITARPSRGADFVPFISKCITAESAVAAPLACALCFEAMGSMAREGVLDAVKAVKIVLKGFANVMDVAPSARRSYLRVLGTVAPQSASKKGKIVARKAIAVLRGCLEEHDGGTNRGESDSLTWAEIGAAASALACFTVDETLRSAHADAEPLEDFDAEKARLEAVETSAGVFAARLAGLLGDAEDAGASRDAHGMQELLAQITSEEWRVRARGAYDAREVARLRATADALRRARARDKGDATRGDDGREAIERALRRLPAGVLRALGECAAGVHRDRAVAAALRVLADARALSPALPWAAVLQSALADATAGATVRAAAAAGLTWSADDGVEIAEARARWLSGSGLLVSEAGVGGPVLGAVFVGIAVHFPEELGRFLDGVSGGYAVLGEIARAACKLQGHQACAQAVRALFERMSMLEEGGDDGERAAAEAALAECLRITDGPFRRQLLTADARDETGRRALQLRLTCELDGGDDDDALVRSAALAACAGGAHEEVVARVGAAVARRGREWRKRLVVDVAALGRGHVPGCEGAAGVVVAFAAGVAVLLPGVRRALGAVGSEEIRVVVARFLDVVGSDGDGGGVGA